jgi:hypothetical protein
MAWASVNPRLSAGVNAAPEILLHWNFRARRRCCEDVKNERNKASGAEIRRSGFATGAFYYGFLLLSFSCFYLPFSALKKYKN